MPVTRYTHNLRVAAKQPGKRVVCSLGPWEGEPVDYSPRHHSDPKPWVLRSAVGHMDDPWRFTGRECHVADAPVKGYQVRVFSNAPEFKGRGGIVYAMTGFTTQEEAQAERVRILGVEQVKRPNAVFPRTAYVQPVYED